MRDLLLLLFGCSGWVTVLWMCGARERERWERARQLLQRQSYLDSVKLTCWAADRRVRMGADDDAG